MKIRSAISVDELASQSQQVAERFFSNVDLKVVHTLHIFLSIQKFNELDTSYIYDRIWREFEQIKTVAPRINLAQGEIESVEFTPESDLIENKWGIREPVRGERINVTDIDMVLVPLLCFDAKGFRVGYGKGFYDIFLSRCRPDCLKVGLSSFPPVEKIDGLGGHDIPLDLCITPDRIYHFK